MNLRAFSCYKRDHRKLNAVTVESIIQEKLISLLLNIKLMHTFVVNFFGNLPNLSENLMRLSTTNEVVTTPASYY